MSRNPIGRGVYLMFKDMFLKHYYYELSRNVTHKDLTPVMVDGKGRTYYEFPESMALPMERFIKQKEYMEWMASGLDGETLIEITDAAKERLTEAISLPAKSKAQTSEFAKVFAMLQEIGDRKDRIIPFDLVINCLCALIVREDENPLKWNQSIHVEKCEYFASRHIDYQFFFQFSAFRELSRLLNVSNENWTAYLAKQKTQQQSIRQSLRIFSTSVES